MKLLFEVELVARLLTEQVEHSLKNVVIFNADVGHFVIFLSAFNFLRVVFLDGQGVMIALTICSAMICIVIFAKILGSMVPLIVKKVGLDPALIANPFISSISDAIALTIYFAMASLFLGL